MVYNGDELCPNITSLSLDTNVGSILPNCKDVNIDFLLSTLTNFKILTSTQQISLFSQLKSVVDIQNFTSIDIIIRAGLFPIIVLNINSPIPLVAYNASWIVNTIICSLLPYDDTLDGNIYHHALELLQSPHVQLREQGLWLIGNLVAENEALRDLTISNGIGYRILQLISDTQFSTITLRVATFVLNNLCKGTPHPDPIFIAKTTHLLRSYLNNTLDAEVKRNIIEAISSLICNIGDAIFLDEPLLKCIIAYLEKEEEEDGYYLPAIRIVGEIFYLNDSKQFQVLLNLNVTKVIKGLLINITDKDVLKQLLLAVSNIATSNDLCIGELISNGIIAIVIKKLKEEEYKIRTECIYIISNIFLTANMEQIKYCIQMGALDLVLLHLKPEMTDVVCVIIDGLRSLLNRYSTSEELSDIRMKILSIDVAIDLCKLFDLKSEDSFVKAKELLEEYYSNYKYVIN